MAQILSKNNFFSQSKHLKQSFLCIFVLKLLVK